jgi:hypothetical protein
MLLENFMKLDLIFVYSSDYNVAKRYEIKFAPTNISKDIHYNTLPESICFQIWMKLADGLRGHHVSISYTLYKYIKIRQPQSTAAYKKQNW